MPKFMSELIGQLAPVMRANIDDDPGERDAVEMQPDVRWPRGVVVHPEPLGLAIGHQAHACQAHLPHTGHDK